MTFRDLRPSVHQSIWIDDSICDGCTGVYKRHTSNKYTNSWRAQCKCKVTNSSIFARLNFIANHFIGKWRRNSFFFLTEKNRNSTVYSPFDEPAVFVVAPVKEFGMRLNVFFRFLFSFLFSMQINVRFLWFQLLVKKKNTFIEKYYHSLRVAYTITVSLTFHLNKHSIK